ncbi:uncharacterized protein A1O5_01024 [Cladophialophora psammophila CBS 110553]|uniref:Uncharacterized protein n=1 Tax=Cladophialophora psammophila CBS 110553 TaxID=1182543 RepID=W9XHU4_9EURO|nr:uncharacterized protein A1O5_01024 [Cladophialophora psammophila CBS 110553]EXJ76516.1 hypothetical protein A1O5_01024 [Cladophialophora psammophila CBS 110553]
MVAATNAATFESDRRYKLSADLLRRLFDLFCLAWVVPIAILLILNYNNWTVGAGVGCRLKWRKDHCYIGLLGTDRSDTSSRAAKLDQSDHEILGALQLVAKALEVWFSIVATSLIYDLTMLLGRQGTGLPMAYLLTHVEFGDISTIFSHTFWTSSGLFSRRRRGSLALFAVLVALLCIACNLMGPATAVLVIPTLGWSESTVPGAERLREIAASDPPSNPAVAPGCDASSLASGNYTCTDYYLPTLDALSSAILFGLQEYQQGYGVNLGIFRESGLSFAFNNTILASESIVWAPNRQVIREMSNDYVEFQATQVANRTFEEARSIAAAWNRNLDEALYNSYRNVLDVSLSRQGPSLGTMVSRCARGNATEIVVSEAKSVRCYYFNWSIDGVYNGYQCIRVGLGWNNASLVNSHFLIGGIASTPKANVSVGAYAETESILLGEESFSCVFQSEGTQPCDWDLLFSGKSPGATINLASQQQYIEYVLSQPGVTNATLVCYSNTYLATVWYNIDISPETNSLGLVSLISPAGDLVEKQQPIAFHPDWVLAAWAVPRFGTVDGNSAAASNLVNALQTAASTQPPQTFGEDPGLVAISNLHAGSLLHALTLVDFTTLNATDAPAGDDALHPRLAMSRRLRVWAYGHSSHTFRVGMVVVIFGSLCVFLRVGLGFYIVSKHRSTTKFLSAALRYRPTDDEFDSLRKKSDMAHFSLRMVQKDAGAVDFVPPQGYVWYRPVHGSV